MKQCLPCMELKEGLERICFNSLCDNFCGIAEEYQDKLKELYKKSMESWSNQDDQS